MKKYKHCSLPVLQAEIDRRFGKGIYKAATVLLLFGMLSLSSGTLYAQTQGSPTPAVAENPRTPLPRITITDTGQTTTLNNITPAPDTPDDGLQRIRSVYFAKKNVTANGANLVFTRIDSAHTQNDAQNEAIAYDSILGKTVYLIIETENLRTIDIDIAIRASGNNLTGNTDTLSLMHFNPVTGNFESGTLFTAKVGNFDALNNNATPASHAHYTNLEAAHADKAIIKLQLRPNTVALFNTWSQNLGTGSVNLEIVAERNDNRKCAYGESTEETAGAGVFLNDNAGGRFRIVNRNVYYVYHADNFYNTYEMNGTNRKRIGKINNNNSEQFVYFYLDRYDNELQVASCNKTSVTGRGNGVVSARVPAGFTSQSPAPAGGEAQTNYYYANDTIATKGTNSTNAVVSYRALSNMVDLVRMPDSRRINLNGTVISYAFTGTQRRYCNPQCFAGFVGALAQFGQQMSSTGMCFGDATSYPSVSHPNGDSIDTLYAADLNTEQKKVNAFHEYGFTHILRGSSGWYGQLQNSNYHSSHETHLHSGDFNDNSVQLING